MAAAAALALAGCSAGSSEGSDGAANVVYVVPSSWASAGAFADNVAAWEEETGNTVEVQAIPDEQYDDTVRARLQGGDGIDIYAGQDAVEDPSAIMLEVDESAFADRMADSVVESMRAADGKIYGYPSADGLSSFGVIYNKDVFGAAGVEVPTTLAELTSAYDSIKATDVTPLFLSGGDGWTLLQHRNAVNADLLGENPDVADELAANDTTWSEVPGMLPQYTALQEWVETGDVNADAVTATYETAIKSVTDGTAATIINGSWAIGELRKVNPDANVGFFALPTEDGANQIALTRPNILHIAASSKVAEESTDLLQFLIEPENVAAHLAIAPGIPAFTDVTVEDMDPAIGDIQAYIENDQAGPAFDTSTTFPTPQDDIIASYQELVAKQIDAKTFLEQLDASWKSAGETAGREGF
ncbi:ABC transporter substrate-binding protein [Agromyces sp. NPDC056965]|uniref:ABC transporter substrate-binding protein n=1 Tax=Agromyces sp. NPDC056965 TaxID=3345983 RepID=UPI00362CA491